MTDKRNNFFINKSETKSQINNKMMGAIQYRVLERVKIFALGKVISKTE